MPICRAVKTVIVFRNGKARALPFSLSGYRIIGVVTIRLFHWKARVRLRLEEGNDLKDLILHSLKMRKVGTVSVLISIALSTCLCLALGLTYGGVTKGIDLSEQRSGSDLMVVPLSARINLTDTTLLFTGAPANVYMGMDVYEQIASMDGVEKASPQFFSQTLDMGCCSVGEETRLIGVDFATDFVVTPLLSQPIDGLASNQIIAGGNVSGVDTGKMRILGEEFEIVEVLPDTGGELDDCIVMDIQTARELAKKMPDYDEIFEGLGDPEKLISTVVIDANEEDPPSYATLCSNIRKISGIALVENSEAIDAAQKQLRSVFVRLAVTTVAMVVITLLQLFARFYTCVWDRKAELALYRAVGADAGALRKMIGGEIGILVLGGCALGLVLGFVGQGMLQKMLIESLEFPFVAYGIGESALLALAIVAAFVLIAFLAVVWPLKQISRIDPSLAMQQGDID